MPTHPWPHQKKMFPSGEIREQPRPRSHEGNKLGEQFKTLCKQCHNSVCLFLLEWNFLKMQYKNSTEANTLRD